MKTRCWNIVFLLAMSSLLLGCGGGSKLLKHPTELELTHALATASDSRLAATLDWVIVKDGPGSWAKNAWWDEYQLRVLNHSDRSISLQRIDLTDFLATPIAMEFDRKQLVKASKESAKNYKQYDVQVRPGAGTAVLVAAGTGSFVVSGVAAAASLASALSFGAAASPPAIVGVVGAASLFAAPVLIVGGVVKGANNSKVNKEILRRQVQLPLEVPAGQSVSVTAFFPVTPSPQLLRLSYDSDGTPLVLNVDTQEVLKGLHLPE